MSHNHHVVPKFYLRRFGDGKKMLRSLNTTTGATSLVPVSLATVAQDFYLVESRTGQVHEGWENSVLWAVENYGALAIRKALDKNVWPLPRELRAHLASFVAAQHLRTPAMRKRFDDSLEQSRAKVDAGGPDAMRAIMEKPHLSDEGARALWGYANQVYPRAQPQNTGTQFNNFAGLLEDTTKDIYERRWSLMTFGSPSLITSDDPVTGVFENGTLTPWILAAGTTVYIPLSRVSLLVIGEPDPHSQRPDDRLVGTPERAEQVNGWTLANATSEVFEHPDDDVISTIMERPAAPHDSDASTA